MQDPDFNPQLLEILKNLKKYNDHASPSLSSRLSEVK